MWIVTIQRQFDGGLLGSVAETSTDLTEALGEELCLQLSTATRLLRALQLTDTETTILKAFILFFTGILLISSGVLTGHLGTIKTRKSQPYEVIQVQRHTPTMFLRLSHMTLTLTHRGTFLVIVAASIFYISCGKQTDTQTDGGKNNKTIPLQLPTV